MDGEKQQQTAAPCDALSPQAVPPGSSLSADTASSPADPAAPVSIANDEAPGVAADTAPGLAPGTTKSFAPDGATPDFSAEYQEAQNALAKRVPLSRKIGIAVVLMAMAAISFCLGQYGVSLPEIINLCASKIVIEVYNLFNGTQLTLDGAAAHALFEIRLPRILVVILVGAALSMAGASYQGMFKNPLVSPDLLGASSGASFGACLALLLDQSNEVVQLAAFAGGMIAVGGAVLLERTVKSSDAILGLVLGGILVSTLFEAGSSLVKLVADADDKLPSITFWLMGSFSSVNFEDLKVIILPMLLGFVLLLLESWKLNVLSFGEEEARSMGIKTQHVRLIVIFASTLIVSCSVAVAGIVGWVGLVIPHLARAVVGPNYRVLLPTSMVIGASYLLLVDDIARLATSMEIPIGILTAILGVPFFVFIFRQNMKGW